jgi:anti-anti-sigma factor
VLDAEVAKQPSTLIIDLSGLRFMDSSALHVILRANRSMDRQGGVLALACPREPVAKMLRLTAADQLVPVYQSVADASAG